MVSILLQKNTTVLTHKGLHLYIHRKNYRTKKATNNGYGGRGGMTSFDFV